MGGDLVEERDRRDARDLGDQARVGEGETDEQRLLLPRRRARGRRVLRPMPDAKIGKMRAGQRAARGGVAAAALPKQGAVAVLRLDRGAVANERLDVALQRKPRPGE